MLCHDQVNWVRPMNMAEARKLGYVDFTFYPTASAATEAAMTRADLTGRKVITFDEVAEIGGHKYVLHIIGETERPRPVVSLYDSAKRHEQREQFWAAANAPTCPPRTKQKRSSAEATAVLNRMMGDSTAPAHCPKLNAFAWFMGEWAAKLRKVVSR